MRFGRYTKALLEREKTRLSEHGFTNPNDNEAYISLYKGEKFLTRVLETAFRYGDIEADELMAPRGSPGYRIIHKSCREELTSHIVKIIEGAGPNTTLTFNPYSDRAMALHVKERYSTPLPDELKSNLETKLLYSSHGNVTPATS